MISCCPCFLDGRVEAIDGFGTDLALQERVVELLLLLFGAARFFHRLTRGECVALVLNLPQLVRRNDAACRFLPNSHFFFSLS
jgi:hypothetical protein